MLKAIRYGTVDLMNGYSFVWRLDTESPEAEIYGFVRTPSGDQVRGSDGWYRTANPLRAAELAESIYRRKI